jgi:hypothetical protein
LFHHRSTCLGRPTTNPDFDLDKGLIVGVIADEVGAPYNESVVAGPVLLVEQPAGAIKLA